MPPSSFPRANTHAADLTLLRVNRSSGAGRGRCTLNHVISSFHRRLPPFLVHLCYFLSLTLLGSLLLALLKPSDAALTAGYLDMLFMSTSAATVSGLAAVAMEDLSSSQLVVLTLLMFLGGEVFVTLLSLLFRSRGEISNAAGSLDVGEIDATESSLDRVESGGGVAEARDLGRMSCARLLAYVVSGYVAVFHVLGTSLLLAYFAGVSTARGILKAKGINVFLFCSSTVVSSFANGGLIATNENMAIFNKDPVILLLMVAQILAGNTLFPLFLRWAIRGLKKLGTSRKEEFGRMLENSDGVSPLLPGPQTAALSLTVLWLTAALLALFCAVDWDGEVLGGLTAAQKFAGALFISVNSRHAGETSVDCSLISPAVLVFLIVMMYLPSSASFAFDHEDDSKKKTKENSSTQRLMFSQLSCLVVFVVAVCIAERRKMRRDPLNFSTLNVIFEVTSGYGNVGLSTGYSCSRLQKLQPGATCEERPYSLSGWLSDEGKLILMLAMLYGRTKKFSAGCGRAWKLY